MQKTIYTPSYRKMIERLRERRRALGLSQRDVAHSLRVSHSWATRVELCDQRLDVLQFVRLCHVLGLSAPSLVRQLDGDLAKEAMPKAGNQAAESGVYGGP